MKTETRSRYESIPKRSFRNGIIRLLEEEFKLIGSHKVIELIADSIIELHKEYYPDIEKLSHGNIIWRTTKATSCQVELSFPHKTEFKIPHPG